MTLFTFSRRVLSLAVAALVFSGCRDSTGPSDVTMSAEFVPYVGFPPGEPFRFSVRNAGNDTLYLETCDDRVTVNFILIGPGSARDELISVCPANLSMVPYALEPGVEYAGVGYAPPRSNAQVQPFISFARAAVAAPNERVKAPILQR